MVDLTPFDATLYLTSDEQIEAFLDDALQSGELVEIADALVLIARAKALTSVLTEAGLPPETLRREPVQDAELSWPMILDAIKVLGLRLTPVTVKTAA